MHKRLFTGFNDQIITRPAQNMTAREIQSFILELYATIYRYTAAKKACKLRHLNLIGLCQLS